MLHGEEDGATLPEETEGQQHFFTRRYERRTLSGVGHFVPREAPAKLSEAVITMLGRQPWTDEGGRDTPEGRPL